MKYRSLFIRRVAGVLFALSIGFAAMSAATGHAATNPKQATKEAPWENSLGMKFVPVPGTDVLFCIWHTRVQDFAAFAKAVEGARAVNGQEVAKDWQTPFPKTRVRTEEFKQEPTHPACNVSWDEAQAFCQWLTKKEHVEGKLPADMRYRLPTDAEWSVVVGLGPENGKTPRDKNWKTEGYPWGAQMPPTKGAGNFCGEENRKSKYETRLIVGYDDGFKYTSPVGSFSANAFGLYDMTGNVWQWCEDLFDPPVPARVLRGSAWCTTDPFYLKSSCRTAAPPDSHYNFNGFRCVLAPVAATALSHLPETDHASQKNTP